MKSYAPPMKRPRKALQSRAFSGVKCSRPTPVFPHIAALLLPPCGMGAGRGTIPLPPVRGKSPAAHRTGPGFHHGLHGQRPFQHGIEGQHRRTEIAAISACPAFPQHIALAIQRQAASVLVIVGAPPFHKGADRRLFLPGQFTAQMLTSRTAGHGSRRHRRCPASRGNHDSGSLWVPAQAREVWAGAVSASWSHKDCW